MPEGDSIWNLAERIRGVLVGRAVTAFEAHAIPDAVAKSVVGHTIVEVTSRGKNLLVRFDDGRTLHIHLRMNGRLGLERPRSSFWKPLRTRPELRLATAAGAIVGNRIPVVRLLVAGGEQRTPDLASLGPDLASDDFDEAEAVSRLRDLRGRTIGEALLIQRAMAGVGNVFKSEVLFLEQTDPRLKVEALDEAHLLRIVRRSRVLLRQNLKRGQRTTRSTLGGARLWVYGRQGKPCLRCGFEIAMIRQGPAPARSTYYCPKCQGVHKQG